MNRARALAVVAGTLCVGGRAMAQEAISPPVQNPANGHWYMLLEASLMPDARAAAAAMGGYIVSISDAEENEWVRANMANYQGVPRRLWIGFTDEAEEGVYTWMNGEEVTYTNWQLSTAQPDNHLGRDPVNGEDYVEMITPALGEWNDQPSCCNVGISPPLHAVVEFDSQPVFGACCVVSSCQITSPGQCAALLGTFMGSGSDCTPVLSGEQVSGPFTSGLPIGPDGGVVTTDTQTVVGPAAIASMSLNVQLTHSWVSDLFIDLRNDTTGTTVRVWNRACGGNDNLSITFMDGGADIACGNPTAGTFAPANPLSAFSGENANGTWSLIITDNAFQDGGTLDSWSITTFESATTVCDGPQCATSDFNGDGAFGQDDDIEAFFLCLGGSCCPTCWMNGADFNGDGASGQDSDIESFFLVLGGGTCV